VLIRDGSWQSSARPSSASFNRGASTCACPGSGGVA
jgi:hypothetical protein